MAASVWMRLVRVSVLAPASPAWTVRPVAETMPEVTVGVSAESPRALPTAMTASPTWSWRVSPKVMGWRFDGGESILSSATSLLGSAPTNLVVSDFVWP